MNFLYKPFRRFLLGTAISFLVAACGQTGPLTYPSGSEAEMSNMQ